MPSYPHLRRIRLKFSNLKEHIQTMGTDQSAIRRRDSWYARKEECVWTTHSSECPIESCTQCWEGFGTLSNWYISFLVIREVVTKHIALEHPLFIDTIDMIFVFDGQQHWSLNLCAGDWHRCPWEGCDWSGQDFRSVTAHRMLAHPGEGPVGTLLPPYLVDPTAGALRMGEGGIGHMIFRPAEYPTAPELARLEGLLENTILLSGDNRPTLAPAPARIRRQCTPHPRFLDARPPSTSTTTGEDEEDIQVPEPRNLALRKPVQSLIRHFDQAYNAVTGVIVRSDNARVTH